MRSLRLRLGTTEILLVPPQDVHHLAQPADAQLVADSIFGAPPLPADAPQAAKLVHDLVSGQALLVRVDTDPRLLDAPLVNPLLPSEPDPVHDDARPTWISLELVHESGIPLASVELELTFADGRQTFPRLDATGRWRADDVPRGSCNLRVLDDERLLDRRRILGPLPATAHEPPLWSVGSTHTLRLTTTAHHRIVVVQPRRFVFSA
jgi:hypothetical protein